MDRHTCHLTVNRRFTVTQHKIGALLPKHVACYIIIKVIPDALYMPPKSSTWYAAALLYRTRILSIEQCQKSICITIVNSFGTKQVGN